MEVALGDRAVVTRDSKGSRRRRAGVHPHPMERIPDQPPHRPSHEVSLD
ncbi:hypothetical protein [Halosaccharopolyspora lacisalsi]